MEMDEILQHERDGLHADSQDCMCDHSGDMMQDDGALAVVGQEVREQLCSQLLARLNALLVSSDPMVSFRTFLTVMQLDKDAFPDTDHPRDALAVPLCQVLQGSKRKEALRGSLSSHRFSFGDETNFSLAVLREALADASREEKDSFVLAPCACCVRRIWGLKPEHGPRKGEHNQVAFLCDLVVQRLRMVLKEVSRIDVSLSGTHSHQVHYLAPLYSKCTRALTFESFSQRCSCSRKIGTTALSSKCSSTPWRTLWH
jgi:hypothetical protein